MASGMEPGWTQGEPPHMRRIPMTLEYLNRYVLDMAHIAPPVKDETLRTFKLRVYNTLHIMAAATRESREMRIAQLHPDTQWMQVWKNLHSAWISEEIASMWYIVVHDIVSTNERLHEIWLVQSDRCRLCGR